MNYDDKSIVNNKKFGRSFDAIHSDLRYNLATKVMSNGVEVIVATDKKARPLEPEYLRLLSSTVTRPITLAPHTLSNLMSMVLSSEQVNDDHNSIKSLLNPSFITDTFYTVFNYKTTIVKNSSTNVSNGKTTVTNYKVKPYSNGESHEEIAPTKTISLSGNTSPTLETEVYNTEYTYINKFLDEDQPLVLSTTHNIYNTIVGGAYDYDYHTNLEPSETFPTTNTYLKTVELTKTLTDGTDVQTMSTTDVLTQVIVTNKPIKRATNLPTTKNITKTYFVTYTYFSTYVDGDKTKVKSDVSVSSDVTIEKYYIKPKKTETKFSEEIKKTESPLNPTSFPFYIVATKTYLTAFTYYTTYLQEAGDKNLQTKVNLKTKLVENTVTETLSPQEFSSKDLNALTSSLREISGSIVATATLLKGDTIVITAYKSPFSKESSFKPEIKFTKTIMNDELKTKWHHDNKQDNQLSKTEFTIRPNSSGTKTKVTLLKSSKSSSNIPVAEALVDGGERNTMAITPTSALIPTTTSTSAFHSTYSQSNYKNKEKNSANAEENYNIDSLAPSLNNQETTKDENDDQFNSVSNHQKKEEMTQSSSNVTTNNGGLINLNVLKPVFNAMAELIQNNLNKNSHSANKKNDTVKDESGLFAEKPVSNNVNPLLKFVNKFTSATTSKPTLEPKPRFTTPRTPVYIPVGSFGQDSKFVESQNRRVLIANEPENWNEKWKNIHAKNFEKIRPHDNPINLLEGGIPISPGQVITTNSDVIIGRPGESGPRPPTFALKNNIPVDMKPPPIPPNLFTVTEEDHLVGQHSTNKGVNLSYKNGVLNVKPPTSHTSTSTSSSSKVHNQNFKNSRLSSNERQKMSTHHKNSQGTGNGDNLKYDSGTIDLNPPPVPPPPLPNHDVHRPHLSNNHKASKKPISHKPLTPNVIPPPGPLIDPHLNEHLTSANLNPPLVAIPAIPIINQPVPVPILQSTPTLNVINPDGILLVPTVGDVSEGNENNVVDRSTNRPFLVNIQPSQVANIVIPHGSSTAVIVGGEKQHALKGEVIDDPSPHPEPETVGFVGSEPVLKLENDDISTQIHNEALSAGSVQVPQTSQIGNLLLTTNNHDTNPKLVQTSEQAYSAIQNSYLNQYSQNHQSVSNVFTGTLRQQPVSPLSTSSFKDQYKLKQKGESEVLPGFDHLHKLQNNDVKSTNENIKFGSSDTTKQNGQVQNVYKTHQNEPGINGGVLNVHGTAGSNVHHFDEKYLKQIQNFNGATLYPLPPDSLYGPQINFNKGQNSNGGEILVGTSFVNHLPGQPDTSSHPESDLFTTLSNYQNKTTTAQDIPNKISGQNLKGSSQRKETNPLKDILMSYTQEKENLMTQNSKTSIAQNQGQNFNKGHPNDFTNDLSPPPLPHRSMFITPHQIQNSQQRYPPLPHKNIPMPLEFMVPPPKTPVRHKPNKPHGVIESHVRPVIPVGANAPIQNYPHPRPDEMVIVPNKNRVEYSENGFINQIKTQQQQQQQQQQHQISPMTVVYYDLDASDTNEPYRTDNSDERESFSRPALLPNQFPTDYTQFNKNSSQSHSAGSHLVPPNFLPAKVHTQQHDAHVSLSNNEKTHVKSETKYHHSYNLKNVSNAPPFYNHHGPIIKNKTEQNELFKPGDFSANPYENYLIRNPSISNSNSNSNSNNNNNNNNNNNFKNHKEFYSSVSESQNLNANVHLKNQEGFAKDPTKNSGVKIPTEIKPIKLNVLFDDSNGSVNYQLKPPHVHKTNFVKNDNVFGVVRPQYINQELLSHGSVQDRNISSVQQNHNLKNPSKDSLGLSSQTESVVGQSLESDTYGNKIKVHKPGVESLNASYNNQNRLSEKYDSSKRTQTQQNHSKPFAGPENQNGRPFKNFAHSTTTLQNNRNKVVVGYPTITNVPAHPVDSNMSSKLGTNSQESFDQSNVPGKHSSDITTSGKVIKNKIPANATDQKKITNQSKENENVKLSVDVPVKVHSGVTNNTSVQKYQTNHYGNKTINFFELKPNYDVTKVQNGNDANKWFGANFQINNNRYSYDYNVSIPSAINQLLLNDNIYNLSTSMNPMMAVPSDIQMTLMTPPKVTENNKKIEEVMGLSPPPVERPRRPLRPHRPQRPKPGHKFEIPTTQKTIPSPIAMDADFPPVRSPNFNRKPVKPQDIFPPKLPDDFMHHVPDYPIRTSPKPKPSQKPDDNLPIGVPITTPQSSTKTTSDEEVEYEDPYFAESEINGHSKPIDNDQVSSTIRGPSPSANNLSKINISLNSTINHQEINTKQKPHSTIHRNKDSTVSPSTISPTSTISVTKTYKTRVSTSVIPTATEPYTDWHNTDMITGSETVFDVDHFSSHGTPTIKSVTDKKNIVTSILSSGSTTIFGELYTPKPNLILETKYHVSPGIRKSGGSANKKSENKKDKSSTEVVVAPVIIPTQTTTLTVTTTMTTVVHSLGRKPLTKTVVLTKTLISTVFNKITETKTLVKPTTATLIQTHTVATTKTTLVVPTALYPPPQNKYPAGGTLKPEIFLADPHAKDTMTISVSSSFNKYNSTEQNDQTLGNRLDQTGDDSIMVVVSNEQPTNSDHSSDDDDDDDASEISDEEDDVSHSKVLVGGIFNANVNNEFTDISKVDECFPKCKPTKNELCQRIKGILKCVCRPGFARMFPDRPCGPTYTYKIKLALDKLGTEKINYEKSVAQTNSADMSKLMSVTKEGLDRMIMQSELRDVYHGVIVNGFQEKEKKAMVNFYVQLSENTDEKKLMNIFKNTLQTSNYSLGGTELFAAREGDNLDAEDFNECLNPKYHDCSEHARCFNLKGTYTCSCKEGYTDVSENSLFPGRLCSDTIGCEYCGYHGACYPKGEGQMTCECFQWYSGERCNINLKVLLIALVTIGAILLALLLVCAVLTCLNKGNKNSSANRSSGYLRYRGPSSHSIDRRAMIGDSSSESSLDNIPYINPPPIIPMPATMVPKKKSVLRQVKGPMTKNIPPPMGLDQRERSVTVMIPRAKYRPVPPLSPHMTMSTFSPEKHLPKPGGTIATEQKLISYLDGNTKEEKTIVVSKNQINRQESDQFKTYDYKTTLIAQVNEPSRMTTDKKTESKIFEYEYKISNMVFSDETNSADRRSGKSIDDRFRRHSDSTHLHNENNRTLQFRKYSAGALVSAGYEVSAKVGMHNHQLEDDDATEDGNSAVLNTLTMKSNRSQFTTLNRTGDHKTMSEARSYDETTVHPQTRSLNTNYSGSSPSSRANNDEGHTMIERDLGSTFIMPESQLFKPEPDRGSDISNFDSL